MRCSVISNKIGEGRRTVLSICVFFLAMILKDLLSLNFTTSTY